MQTVIKIQRKIVFGLAISSLPLFVLFLFSMISFACTSEALENKAFDEALVIGALEAEIEAESVALTDSLFLQIPLYRSGQSRLWHRFLLMKEDMFWLLYDEPIMLFIDDWEYCPDSITVY